MTAMIKTTRTRIVRKNLSEPVVVPLTDFALDTHYVEVGDLSHSEQVAGSDKSQAGASAVTIRLNCTKDGMSRAEWERFKRMGDDAWFEFEDAFQRKNQT